MLSVVATMEHRETCQCRPKQGPAMKRRATVDSSAAESTYKVRGSYSGNTSAFQADAESSILLPRSTISFGV